MDSRSVEREGVEGESGRGSTSLGSDSSAGRSPDEIEPLEWVRQERRGGANPRVLLCSLVGENCPLPEGVEDAVLWRLLVQLLSRPTPRSKLPNLNSLADVVDLIRSSRKILVLTGAGISVSSGIPDFRSPTGVYSRLSREFPELPEPQAMFDIHYFHHDPRPFFRFAKEIYPGQFSPSPSHRFIAALERRNKLLRNYSQNIDTLEQAAGISRVVYCHGSFTTASCTRCRHQVDCESIRQDIMDQCVPLCSQCSDGDGEGEGEGEEGVMKPDIVFFGEPLPATFHQALEEDKSKADLLLVMGSSLKVRPVSLVPCVLEGSVPQVLINREPLPHMRFDVELLGYSDAVVGELCWRLGEEWVGEVMGKGRAEPGAVHSVERHVHLFPGALWGGEKKESRKKRARDGCTASEQCCTHKRPHIEEPS